MPDPSDPVYQGLSTRARKFCWLMDLNNREEILQAIQTHTLFPSHQNRKRRPVGYGWVTHFEICEWLGLPRPIKTSFPPATPPPTLPPLTPQQATENFHLLLDIVNGDLTPKKLLKELRRQLTALIAQGIQGDDTHPNE